MWQALRSDLKEFVAVVTDPNASNDGDDDDEVEELSPALEEAIRRMGLDETFTESLLDVDHEFANESDDGDLAADREQIQEYIDSFVLEDYEEEIARALDAHGELLQPILQRLVPEIVTRKDFWMRYFYHCSVDRIQQEISEQENRERLERVSQSIQGVKSFLGGAVMSVASSMLEDDEGGMPAISPFHMNAGGKKRPPFVMNTAVDDDDEGENEELGWSDDDEVEDDEDEDEAEAQIEFKDAATEQLQEQLKQALEERDLLHQTVELQQKEIAELRGVQANSEQPVFVQEVDDLKRQLFEKESELAILRSKDERSSVTVDDNSAGELAEKVILLERENEQLRAALEEWQSPVVAADDGKLAALEKEKIDLVSKLETMEAKLRETSALNDTDSGLTQQMESLMAENNELKAILKEKEADYNSKLDSTQLEVAELRDSIGALEDDKEKLQAILDTTKSELSRIRAEFDTGFATKNAELESVKQENSVLKMKLDEKKAALADLQMQTDSLSKQLDSSCGESAASPDSVVKVEVDDDANVPLPGDVRKADDGSDDWGDDWGDEDD